MEFVNLHFFITLAVGCTLLVIILAFVWYITQFHLYLYAWGLHLPPPHGRISIKYNLLMPMSDGVNLVADLFHPQKPGRYPTILMRTPYGKGSIKHNYPLIATIFASQGYHVLIQDIRGKYGSEGTFIPFVNEESDGKDSIEWISKQSWSDGQVALWGFSYLGSCAWLSAPNAPEALKVIIPMFSCHSAYMGWIDNGVPHLKDILMWLLKHHGRKGKIVTHKEVDDMIMQLPVLKFDERLEVGVETFKTWMYHLHTDEYWTPISVAQRLDQVDVPALFVAGWFDRFANHTMKDFNRSIALEKNTKLASSRLIIGPWGHNPTKEFKEMSFGYHAKFRHQFNPMVRWLNHWMKKTPLDFNEKKPVDYFMMGKNEWRNSESWPPKGTQEVCYYLKSQGRANTFYGNGILSRHMSHDAHTDHYDYDPEDPTPSLGNRMLYGNNTDGPCEQLPLYERKDILFYHSYPLLKEVEVAGLVKAVIYVSSKAIDTDFSAKLCVRCPNKASFYLVNGFVRMRFFEEIQNTHGMDPEKIYKVELDLGHIAYTFLKGEQIQLQIASCDFPNHERNLNTGKSNETEALEVIATQTIYHGGMYDSHLILPILTIDE